jgi:ligand-binding sensor domain-containing protein
MVENGDYLWVGSYGGLTKLHRTTGAMTHYNRANSGLPDNSVSSIARDVNGDLWIGTRGGLAKFDGKDWTVYRSETCLQPGNGVGCLAIDENGVKWIGVYGRGLARFDGTSWTFYTESNSGLPTDDFRSITIDAKGNKWLGTNGRGLAKFDGSSWTVYDPKNSGIPGVGVYPIVFDTNGDLWVGCQGWDYPNGLAKFDGTRWIVYDTNNSQLPHNCVRSIAVDKDGSKWIGTYHGLVRLDDAGWTAYDTDRLQLAATDCMSLPDQDLSTILIDTDGIKWLGFYGGLVRFDGTNWTLYNTGNSLLQDNHVTSMAVDVQGTRWIMTWGGGLAKFDDAGWTIYNGLNSDIPDAGDAGRILAVDDEAAWLAIRANLVRFKGTTWTTYTTGNSGLPGAPRCVAVDAGGHKWVGTTDGLAETDGLEWTVYRSENSPLPSNDVGVVVIDGDGNKWIGGGMPSHTSTKGPKGLVKFDGTEWTVYNTDNSGLPSNRVLCLAVDEVGNKWIGTDEGLVKFNGTDWIVYAAAASWLCAAPDGSIWGLEASKGSWNMFRVRDDAWTVINLDDSGLPSFLINCFCVGPRGDFWFGTDGGLGCLTQADLSGANGKSTLGVAHPFPVARVQRKADKPVALPVPMAQFPHTLNGWTGQDLLVPTTTQEYMRANLPDDYFSRRYVNGDTGRWADLYVVYCSSEPMCVFGHQPRHCYPANGWTWDQTDPLRIVTQSGRRIDCLVDRFHRASPAHQEIVVLSFYVLSGRLHAGERDLVDFWPQGPNTSRDPARYAAQVQVASDLETSARSAACATADTILEFLPDPNGVVHAGPNAKN